MYVGKGNSKKKTKEKAKKRRNMERKEKEIKKKEKKIGTEKYDERGNSEVAVSKVGHR